MIYIFFIFFWPFINYLGSNISKITFDYSLAVIAFVLLGLSISTFIIIKIFKKPTDRFLFTVFMSILLFFGYGYIYDHTAAIISNLYIIIPAIKTSYFYALIFTVVIYFSWMVSAKKTFQTVSKIFIIVVFTSSVANMAIKIIRIHEVSALKCDVGGTDGLLYEFRHKPNVYYILVDAYARQDILKEITGYDNELFLKELEKKEFIVSRNARSNYSFTKASLSATMDLSYHEPDKIKIFSYASMRESLSGKNKVREVFRRNGYHIVNIPAHWYETRCFGNEDTCVKKGSVEVYQSFLSPTPLRIFISPSTYVDLDLVKDASDVAPGKPKFVFAHIAQLHDAVYDGYGNMHRVQSNRDSISYVSTVKIMNAKILGFIEYIRAKDPKSIIIIQADHGPPAYIVSQNYGKELHLKNKQDFRFKFGIFTGIYLPKYDINKYAKIRKYFSDFFTLINTFRYVFAYLSDQEPELLPEESHFLYPDKSGLSYIEDNIDQLTN